MDGPKDIRQLDMGLLEIRSELPVFLLIDVWNHRVVVVGGDLWRLSSPSPSPLSRATESQLLGTTSRWLLNVSKDRDFSCANLRQPVTLTVKMCFLMFRGNLLYFSVCSWPLVLVCRH